MQRSNSTYVKQPQQTAYTQSVDTARYSSTHSTSSAFSASANANEDWTKISDLAERRRIQNRIAQRNYRKKLKRRLEDLERKAASTSASPEPSHAELAVPSAHGDSVSSSSSSRSLVRQASRTSRTSSTTSQDQQFSPELFPLEDPFANITVHDQQYQYLSLPLSYPNGATGSDYFTQDFSFCGTEPVLHRYAEPPFQTNSSHSLPPTLPAMNQLDPLKQNPFSIDDDFLNPFGISYATLVGMDLTSQQSSAGFMSRSPSSSDGWSSNGSRGNSPPYFAQPMTPLSRSTSPNVHLFDQSWVS